MAAAIAIPAATGWYVHVHDFPPLHAKWDPRVGPGSVAAALLAVAGGIWAIGIAERLPWGRLLLAAYSGGLAWLLALAYVDGNGGIGTILDTNYEYMRTARHTSDIGLLLHQYVERIGFDAPLGHWPVHVAGHPPGALLFFVLLVRIGLTTGLAAGFAVTVVAATTPLAVLTTLRALHAEQVARRAAPFLVLGPAAVWQAVSADAVFAAVAAWGIALLALAAVRRNTILAASAGVVLGYAVMMSYGLPIMGVLALTVLWLARSWHPLAPALLAAAGVVVVFAVLGFAYWDALPVIHDRYWEGVGGRRQPEYWIWGGVAAFLISAGPMAAAGLGQLVSLVRGHGAPLRRLSSSDRVAAALAAAGWGMVLLADGSQMSRAETERIWLPFAPWVLVACALLPSRWRRGGLWVQVGAGLVVQHLLATGW